MSELIFVDPDYEDYCTHCQHCNCPDQCCHCGSDIHDVDDSSNYDILSQEYDASGYSSLDKSSSDE